MIRLMSTLHERISLAGEKGLPVGDLPSLTSPTLRLLLSSNLFDVKNAAGESVAMSLDDMWEQRHDIRVSVRLKSSTRRARGITCREDQEAEHLSEVLDLVSLARDKGVMLADKDKLGAKVNFNSHVSRLLTSGVLVRRRVSVAKRIHTSVIHLRKHSRDYDPSSFDCEYEASDEMKETVVGAILNVLSQRHPPSMLVSDLAAELGCSRHAGSTLRDLVRENYSKPEFPLFLVDTDGVRIENIDKPGFTRKYLIAMKETKVESKTFGSLCVFNMPLMEQAASYLCESEGVSSADFSLMLGVERKRSARMVQDFNDVYKYRPWFYTFPIYDYVEFKQLKPKFRNKRPTICNRLFPVDMVVMD